MKTSPFLFIGFALILYNVLGIVEAKVKADARKELRIPFEKNDSTLIKFPNSGLYVIRDSDWVLFYSHLY